MIDCVKNKEQQEGTEIRSTRLYERLKRIQERHGYTFNADMEMTMDLLNSLVVLHERHGYMACPCRLVSGSYEHDRDILCPCVYRETDVEEYGACFCGLYVAIGGQNKVEPFVPDRRPAELVLAACHRHEDKHGAKHVDCK